MKHESRTIGQSRTFALAVCIRLEVTWWPSARSLSHFQLWDNAVRECKGRSRWYVLRRWGRSYQQVVLKRDRALRDLLAVRRCGQ